MINSYHLFNSLFFQDTLGNVTTERLSILDFNETKRKASILSFLLASQQRVCVCVIIVRIVMISC